MLALAIPAVVAQIRSISVANVYGPAAASLDVRSRAPSAIEGAANITLQPTGDEPVAPIDFASMTELERHAFILETTRAEVSPWVRAGLEDPRVRVTCDDANLAWVLLEDPSRYPWHRTRTGRVVWWCADAQSLLDTIRDDVAMYWFREKRLVNPFNTPTHMDVTEMPSWSVFSECPTEEIHWKVAVEQQFGWPFKSAHSVLWLESTGGKGRHHGYAAMADFGQQDGLPTRALLIGNKKPDGTRESTRHIPLGIIWSGLAINTLIYACFTFALTTLMSVCKRRIRRARGRCPMCRYRLEGNVADGCPECGWRRRDER